MANKAFFMRRLNEHIQYLKKIDAAIKGENNFQGMTHRECQLGQWLYNEGAAEIAAMNNHKAQEIFESLLEPHERFHTLGHQALEKKQIGDDTGVKAIMTELHVLSTVLTNKLLELDRMN